MTGLIERRSSPHLSEVVRAAFPRALASGPPGPGVRDGRPAGDPPFLERASRPRIGARLVAPKRSGAGHGGTALVLVLALASLGGPGSVTEAVAASAIEEGREIALDRKKGNCMACHVMAGATLPGNIGPPLVAMKARFPDKAKLREQIWDASQINPRSLMPPFGRHAILTEDEIDKVVEFVHAL